jgi:hypothetical protein
MDTEHIDRWIDTKGNVNILNPQIGSISAKTLQKKVETIALELPLA